MLPFIQYKYNNASKGHMPPRAYGTHLYAFVSQDWVKIGRSKHISKRLAEVRSAMPFELELLGSWQDCGNYERKVHEGLIAFAQHGGWFKCSPDVALAAVQNALTCA